MKSPEPVAGMRAVWRPGAGKVYLAAGNDHLAVRRSPAWPQAKPVSQDERQCRVPVMADMELLQRRSRWKYRTDDLSSVNCRLLPGMIGHDTFIYDKQNLPIVDF